jgi:hypothetical protein
VRARSGPDRVDGDLERTVGAVLEPDGHRHTRSELTVHLRFGRCECKFATRKGVSRVIRLYHDQLLLPESVHQRQTLTSCADGTPRDQIGNVLRRDGVEEFASGRETNVGDFEQEPAGEPETLVDLVRAVELRICDAVRGSVGESRGKIRIWASRH